MFFCDCVFCCFIFTFIFRHVQNKRNKTRKKKSIEIVVIFNSVGCCFDFSYGRVVWIVNGLKTSEFLPSLSADVVSLNWNLFEMTK